jgi:hypothetical protein
VRYFPFLLVPWCFACDPGYSVTGRVGLPDGGGFENVEVTLECGARAMLSGDRRTYTHDGGLFLLMGVGCLPSECKVTFSQDGGESHAAASLECRSRSFMCGKSECSKATARFAQ